MGFMRKALFLGTGGLSGMAGVRANSKKERTAKAAEKQVRLQQRQLRGSRQTATSATSFVKPKTKFNVSCPHCRRHFFAPIGENIACPKCGERMDVQRGAGRAGIRRIRAVVPAPLDIHGRAIAPPGSDSYS
jgi:Zn finger protein HypA/HybF involved in hydrogenase expression